MARVALLACVGRLAFVVCAFGGFMLAYAFLTIAPCNTDATERASLWCTALFFNNNFLSTQWRPLPLQVSSRLVGVVCYKETQ